MRTSVTIGRPAYRPADPRAEPPMMLLASLLVHRGTEWSGAWVFEHPDIAWAHNDLFAQFIASKSERLIIIDTDILFRPSDAIRLLDAEEDYVGANYARKKHGAGWASTPKAAGRQRGHLVEAEIMATGFLALSRSAVERLTAETKHPFTTGIGADGRWHGSDEALCRRWQALGEVAWIDTSIRVGHVGTHIFEGES